MWKYELFRDSAGKWRWHLLSHGRVVATSGEAFASHYDARRAVANVKHHASTAALPPEADSDPNLILRRALLGMARRNTAAQEALHARLFGSH